MSQNTQNHYSVDEMLQAAKSKAKDSSGKKSETREVIIKEDGTKVVRVKRRKRKSSNESELLSRADDQSKVHLKTLIVTLAVLILGSLSLAGWFFFKVAYFNSPDFISQLETNLNLKLNSITKVQGYRLSATKSQADKVLIDSQSSLLPPLKAEFKNLSFSHRFESVLAGALFGNEAHAESGLLTFDFSKKDPPLQQRSKAPSDTFSLPYRHKDLEVEKTSIIFGEGKAAPLVSEAYGKIFKKADGNLQLYFRNGTLKNIQGLPTILDSVILSNSEEILKIQTLKLNDGSVGYLDISGDFSKASREPQSLTCDFIDLRLEHLNEYLNQILEVKINSEQGTIMIDPFNQRFQAKVSLDHIERGLSLKNLKFQDSIGDAFGDYSLPYIHFPNSSQLDFAINNSGYHFSNLHLDKHGKLSLRGNFSVDFEGKISGNLSVGVPTAQIMKQFPDVDPESLKKSKGYSWFDITLSGTTTDPQDNFKEIFYAVVDRLE